MWPVGPALTTLRTSIVPASSRVAVRSRSLPGLVTSEATRQRQMRRGRHLLGVVGRHPPDLAAREEELALVPVVVVLLPGLEAVRRAVDQDEVAVPLRRVQDARVAEGPGEVVLAAVLLQDARLQRGAGRPLLVRASASG